MSETTPPAFQYLLIHVQFSVVGQSVWSLTDCYLVSVHWHHVEAEIELVNGQTVVPGVILKHSYRQRNYILNHILLQDLRHVNRSS